MYLVGRDDTGQILWLGIRGGAAVFGTIAQLRANASIPKVFTHPTQARNFVIEHSPVTVLVAKLYIVHDALGGFSCARIAWPP